MKALYIIILLLSSVFIPCSAFSKQAATIDELVEMYDIKRCAECHADKYEDWKTSTMGNSIVDSRVLRGMRSFIRLSLDEEESLARKDLVICLNCHIPQIKDAAPELIIHIGDLILTAVEDKNEANKEAAKKENQDEIEEEIGDIIFSVVNASRFLGVHPEEALRKTTTKFMERFGYIEKKAKERGVEPRQMTLKEMDALWDEAKQEERKRDA